MRHSRVPGTLPDRQVPVIVPASLPLVAALHLWCYWLITTHRGGITVPTSLLFKSFGNWKLQCKSEISVHPKRPINTHHTLNFVIKNLISATCFGSYKPFCSFTWLYTRKCINYVRGIKKNIKNISDTITNINHRNYRVSRPIRRTYFPEKMWPKFDLRFMRRG